MDLTTPIDIQAVIGAVKEHRDLLTTLDAEQAAETLQHFTAIPGVKDSLVLGRTTLGKISHKYTGTFIGQVSNGTIVPRTLKVYPCVMEMDDEPERYRRTYIQEVKGGLDPYSHPFEVWLLNYGYKCASKELFDVMLTAKYDAYIRNLNSWEFNLSKNCRKNLCLSTVCLIESCELSTNCELCRKPVPVVTKEVAEWN